jgi:hypothetical protein
MTTELATTTDLTIVEPTPLDQGVEYASRTSLLRDFRRQLEYYSGGSVHELAEVNTAELLSDLCIFLGLSDQNRRKILGARAATYLDQTLTTRAVVMIKH